MVNIDIGNMIKKMLYLYKLSLFKHSINLLQVMSTDLNVVGVNVVRFIRRGIENKTRMVFKCRNFTTLLNNLSCQMLNIKLKKHNSKTENTDNSLIFFERYFNIVQHLC